MSKQQIAAISGCIGVSVDAGIAWFIWTHTPYGKWSPALAVGYWFAARLLAVAHRIESKWAL